MNLQHVGKYIIISVLGRGSMGVVYKARDPEIGRLVAIKTLRPAFFAGDDSGNDEALQRFRQESRSAGKLEHPNIVMIYEAGRGENNIPYIVMEYVDGPSLETLITERGRMEPIWCLHCLAQLASAIDYAHRQNVIHRDIKPSNILLDASYRPHLLDFGVAKFSDTSLTPPGTVVGTPSYMSPEQIRGETLDGSTDRFTLAVVAYELLTGARPFPGKDFVSIVNNILHTQPLRTRGFGLTFPRELENIFQRALAKDPRERFQSALEFVDRVASVFSVGIDGTGVIGFSPHMTAEDASHRSAPSLAFSPHQVSPEGTPAFSQSSLGVGKVESETRVENGKMPVTSYLEEAQESPRSAYRNCSVERNHSTAQKSSETGIGESGVLPNQQGDTLGIENGEAEGSPEAQPGSNGKRLPEDSILTTNDTPTAQRSVHIALNGHATKKVSLSRRQNSPWFWTKTLGFLGIVGLIMFLIIYIQPSELTDQGTSVPLYLNSSEEQAQVTEPVTETLPASDLSSDQDRSGSVQQEQTHNEPVDSEDIHGLGDDELILLMISSDRTDILRQALEEVSQRKNVSFRRACIKLTAHPDPLIRVYAIKAWSALVKHAVPAKGDDQDVQAIVQRLDDQDTLVRAYAAKALGGIHSSSARNALKQHLRVETKNEVVQIIKESLGNIEKNI